MKKFGLFVLYIYGKSARNVNNLVVPDLVAVVGKD